jgi:hypothetical protein
MRAVDSVMELPTPAGHEVIRAELELRLQRAILEPGRAVGRDLPVLGVSERPQDSCYWQRGDGSWMFATDYRTDPTFAALDGRIAMPRAALEAFAALTDAGLECDTIWMVHDLPPTWRPGDPIPGVPDPPAARRSRSGPDKVASAPQRIRQAAAKLNEVRATAPQSISVGLDPVVLGGLTHAETGAVLWVELARWDWE